jgi:hypothetical protein
MPAERNLPGRGALGEPPRFALARVVRPTFYVEFEYDGIAHDFEPETNSHIEEPARRVQKRSFFSKAAAYKWLARRMIFLRRDKWCGRYDASDPDPEDGSCRCKYHHDASFRRLEARIARWLMWRDSRRAAP